MNSGARLTRWVGIVVAIHLALHLYVLATIQFGVHRDEFLYFSMGRHLRFWRMDFPPLIAVFANASRRLFADSLASVRVFPMLEGAVLIALTALIARDLGGGAFAHSVRGTDQRTGVVVARGIRCRSIHQNAGTIAQSPSAPRATARSLVGSGPKPLTRIATRSATSSHRPHDPTRSRLIVSRT